MSIFNHRIFYFRVKIKKKAYNDKGLLMVAFLHRYIRKKKPTLIYFMKLYLFTYLPTNMGRMWHKVNFQAVYSWFEFPS